MSLFDFDAGPSSKSSGPDYGPGCVLLIVLGISVKGITWIMDALSKYAEMDFPYSLIAAWYFFLAKLAWATGKICLFLLFWPFFCEFTDYARLNCLIALLLFFFEILVLWVVWGAWEDLHLEVRVPPFVMLGLLGALIGPGILAGVLKLIEFLLTG